MLPDVAKHSLAYGVWWQKSHPWTYPNIIEMHLWMVIISRARV